MIVLALVAPRRGGDPNSAAARIERGRSAYAAGRFDEALAAFEGVIKLNPKSAVPRYNAAAALYRLERYSDALARYHEAHERADADLRTKIDYALGNTALTLGDLTAAVKHYDDCLGSTTRGPLYDAIRRDAALNRQYAEEQSKPLGIQPIPQRTAPTRRIAPNRPNPRRDRTVLRMSPTTKPRPSRKTRTRRMATHRVLVLPRGSKVPEDAARLPRPRIRPRDDCTPRSKTSRRPAVDAPRRHCPPPTINEWTGDRRPDCEGVGPSAGLSSTKPLSSLAC